jgi:hypothetical protein
MTESSALAILLCPLAMVIREDVSDLGDVAMLLTDAAYIIPLSLDVA